MGLENKYIEKKAIFGPRQLCSSVILVLRMIVFMVPMYTSIAVDTAMIVITASWSGLHIVTHAADIKQIYDGDDLRRRIHETACVLRVGR